MYFTVYTFFYLKFGKLLLSGHRDMNDSFWVSQAMMHDDHVVSGHFRTPRV